MDVQDNKQPIENFTDLPNNDDVEKIEQEQQQFGSTERGLKSRHVQLIALGGCIGTGLFVGSGAILSNSGPASLLIAYIIMSFVIWTIMNCLGEMTTYLPLAGASPPMYIHRFADESTAFAAGWNYWYAYAFLVPSEITAAAIVIEYWTDVVPTAAWIAIVWVIIVALNIFMVKIFGETEFWFASLKIIAIIGLIIVGIVIFFGGAPSHDRLGFRYWKHDAFKEYIVSGASGRFCGFWNALVRSGFSFIMSPELITISAGETEAPRRNIPKATRRFIWRLLFFYILGSLVIGVIVSSSNPMLMSGSGDASASPFVIGIKNAGIPVLNHIINAAILTSAWSAGNSFLFAGSRTLFSLAKEGEAPAIFKYCNRWGVPVYSVLATSAVALLAFLNVSSSSANVFTWFTNLSTVSGFLAWLCVLTAYLRFRKALQHFGVDDTRPFKTPFQPYASYITFFIVGLLTITNGFTVFVGGSFSGGNFVAAYVTLPIFAVLYFGHKAWTKNWKFVYPVEEVDIFSGLDEVERVEALYSEREPKNWLEKFWFWIA
jgi:amino acid transporter